MNWLWPYLWVSLGAAIGGALRHGSNRLGGAIFGLGFPSGTLFVNLAGGFVMGALTSWFAFRGEQSNQALRLFLTTGVLGGFTTFSAFSLDTAVMWQRGQVALAAGYVVASVVGSLLAVFAGLALVRAILA
jgi:CrcB protein